LSFDIIVLAMLVVTTFFGKAETIAKLACFFGLRLGVTV